MWKEFGVTWWEDFAAPQRIKRENITENLIWVAMHQCRGTRRKLSKTQEEALLWAVWLTGQKRTQGPISWRPPTDKDCERLKLFDLKGGYDHVVRRSLISLRERDLVIVGWGDWLGYQWMHFEVTALGLEVARIVSQKLWV